MLSPRSLDKFFSGPLSNVLPGTWGWGQTGHYQHQLIINKQSKKCLQHSFLNRSWWYSYFGTRVRCLVRTKFRPNIDQNPTRGALYCQIMRKVCINLNKYKVFKNIWSHIAYFILLNQYQCWWANVEIDKISHPYWKGLVIHLLLKQ